MCKVSLNQDLNGIEISFEKKPEQATLNAIKEQGFRWHRAKKVWYAKQTKDRLTFAESLGEIGTTTTTQAELIDRYMDIICKEVWTSENMRNYARKNIGYIVELDNGDIMDIEKPRIETSFCFGFGMYGIDPNGEGQERASKAEQTARTDSSYFISENLKGLDSMIEALKDKETYYFYKYLHYSGQESGSHLKAISYCRLGNTPEYEPWRWSNLRDFEEITDKERESILKGYEEVKKAFIKRLNTYLKRYGLSKLNTWTYLVD